MHASPTFMLIHKITLLDTMGENQILYRMHDNKLLSNM